MQYKCNSCHKPWPGEVLKLVSWTVNGHAEAILLCPVCQSKYIGHNPNYTFLNINPEVIAYCMTAVKS